MTLSAARRKWYIDENQRLRDLNHNLEIQCAEYATQNAAWAALNADTQPRIDRDALTTYLEQRATDRRESGVIRAHYARLHHLITTGYFNMPTPTSQGTDQP